MTDAKHNMYDEMLTLENDSRVVKQAHFIAAQKKRWTRSMIGVLIIFLNVLIGSTLIDFLLPQQAAALIRGLAVFAAALAGIQTFFNFQKDVESHLSSGDTYGSIHRRVRLLIAEYKDGSRNSDDVIADFKKLIDDYLKANAESKGCIPSDKDYDQARAAIRKAKELELEESSETEA